MGFLGAYVSYDVGFLGAYVIMTGVLGAYVWYDVIVYDVIATNAFIL